MEKERAISPSLLLLIGLILVDEKCTYDTYRCNHTHSLVKK